MLAARTIDTTSGRPAASSCSNQDCRTSCGEVVDLLPQLIHYGVAPSGRPRRPGLMRCCCRFRCIGCQVLLAVQHDERPLLADLHPHTQQDELTSPGNVLAVPSRHRHNHSSHYYTWWERVSSRSRASAVIWNRRPPHEYCPATTCRRRARSLATAAGSQAHVGRNSTNQQKILPCGIDCSLQASYSHTWAASRQPRRCDSLGTALRQRCSRLALEVHLPLGLAVDVHTCDILCVSDVI